MYRWHIWRWVLGILLVLIGVAAGTAFYLSRHLEPILRERVVAALSDHFHAQVQLDQLHISLLNGLDVSGSGLTIPMIETSAQTGPDTNLPPLATVSSFRFHLFGVSAVFQKPLHIGTVYVSGMKLMLPPKGERPNLNKIKGKNEKLGITVDKILCDDAVLSLGTNKPGKQPLVFDISHLVLTHIVPGEALEFNANLLNPKPVGAIASTGSFGPWNSDSPGETPVSGHYSFSNADLSTIKGVAGILSSTGNFGGVLDQIVVDGTTDVPDFRLDITNHPMPLHTDFHATVDGTTGNVTLNPVQAKLLESTFTVNGSVIRTPGIPGHNVDLNVKMARGRIEDMLRLAVKSEVPLMTGALNLDAHIQIPQGDERVMQKIIISGKFMISKVIYSSDKVQQKMDMLSLRAQGLPKEANPAGAAENQVTSRISGQFEVANEVINIEQLDYEMPGTEVLLSGTYAMGSSSYDFRGKLRTKAKLSQMTTGMASILLRAVDRIFSKDGAGTQIPVKINGTKADMHFGVDLKALMGKNTSGEEQYMSLW